MGESQIKKNRISKEAKEILSVEHKFTTNYVHWTLFCYLKTNKSKSINFVLYIESWYWFTNNDIYHHNKKYILQTKYLDTITTKNIVELF